MTFATSNVVVSGPTDVLHAIAFPPSCDSHVELWYRWRFLHSRGIVDRDGTVLVGRQRGQRIADHGTRSTSHVEARPCR